MAGVRIRIHPDLCQCTGYCARICPSVFSVDKALGHAVPLQPVVNDPALLEEVEQAEQTCPTRAIELIPAES
jgi:ferredoxin